MGDIADLLIASYFDEMDNIDAIGNVYLPDKFRIKGPGQCPRCDKVTILKEGKFGKFYGCCDFPNCKGSRYYK